MKRNFNIMNYDPRECPCRNCDKRHAFCHGECEQYKEFIATRPKKPTNTYCESGKMTDPFHKKGRVIRNG